MYPTGYLFDVGSVNSTTDSTKWCLVTGAHFRCLQKSRTLKCGKVLIKGVLICNTVGIDECRGFFRAGSSSYGR